MSRPGSLRLRLTGAVVALVATALAGLAVLLYLAVSRAAWEQHDRGLLGRARALAALVEHDEEGYDFELSGTDAPAFAASTGRTAYFELWLPNGAVLARSPSLAGRDLPKPPVGDAPRFQGLRLPDGREGRLVVARFLPRDEGDEGGDGLAPVTLVLADDTADVRATLAVVRSGFGKLALATLLAVAAATAWLVSRGLRPLGRLATEIEAIDDRRLSARLPLADQPAELATPVRKLNELLARLDASFARERRFTADVSHELRTPLAGLRTLLDVTALQPRTPSEYRAALAQARGIVIELSALVENLLTLARLDSGSVEVTAQDVALRELVDECWRPHADAAAQRGLRFENRIEATTRVTSDREQLRLVVRNLLANAASYTETGGWIAVEAGPGGDGAGAGVILDVADSGPPIPAEHLDTIFERFWRADASRTAGSVGGTAAAGAPGPHCGIGLALVRSVCGHLGLAVSAATLPDGSVRFRVDRVA